MAPAHMSSLTLCPANHPFPDSSLVGDLRLAEFETSSHPSEFYRSTMFSEYDSHSDISDTKSVNERMGTRLRNPGTVLAHTPP
jgi:hypothetical protein